MPPTVSDAAAQLREKVEQAGEMPIEEANAFVEELGVVSQQRGLVLGYGANQRNLWWHRDNGVLYAGPKDGAGGGGPGKPLVDPSTLETPVEQFEAVAVQLGVAAKPAKAAAFYLDNNFDLNDPASVATGLKEVTEINAALKRRLYLTWTSFTQGEVTNETRQRAKQLEASDNETAPDANSQNGHYPARRYAALNGEVLPVANDDPGGMSLGEAIAVSNTQTRASSNGHGGDEVLATVLRENGENSRQAMTLLSQANQKDPPDPPPDNTELILKLIEANMATDRERTASMFQQMATSQEHMVEKLSEGLAQVAQMASQKKSPFEELDSIFPGLGKKMMERLIDPPQQDSSGLKLNLLGFGSNGEDSAEVTLDAYERIKNIQQKDDMLNLAKTSFPQFIRMAGQLSEAVKMSAAAEKEAKADDGLTERPRPEMVRTNCVNPDCQKAIAHRVGAQAWQCPPSVDGERYGCGAVMDETGDWLTYEKYLERQKAERQSAEESSGQGEEEPDAPTTGDNPVEAKTDEKEAVPA